MVIRLVNSMTRIIPGRPFERTKIMNRADVKTVAFGTVYAEFSIDECVAFEND